jgi:hypothetical protein
MAYRDVGESLRSYRARIANDLDEVRRAARELEAQAARATVLEKELAETDALLAKMEPGEAARRLPMLDNVRVAAPCPERWDEMVGDDYVRYCGRCEKNVYNLSSLTRHEAEALLGAKDGEMCVRLFRRADGTVMTSDCSVGVKRRRRRRAAVAAVGGGLMAAAAALGLESRATTGVIAAPQRPSTEQWTAGLMAVPQEDVPVTMGSAAPDPPSPPHAETPAQASPPHGYVMGRRRVNTR